MKTVAALLIAFVFLTCSEASDSGRSAGSSPDSPPSIESSVTTDPQDAFDEEQLAFAENEWCDVLFDLRFFLSSGPYLVGENAEAKQLARLARRIGVVATLFSFAGDDATEASARQFGDLATVAAEAIDLKDREIDTDAILEGLNRMNQLSREAKRPDNLPRC